MEFDIKCKNQDKVLVTYGYVASCLPSLSDTETIMRLTNKPKITCVFDTGSSISYIEKSILNAICAEPLPSRCEVITLNGKIIKQQYRVDICLPNNMLVRNQIVCPMDTNFGMIIGMDIIETGTLTLYHRNTDDYIRFSLA